MAIRDRFGRPMHDLRISVTDRCNFRCPYCMPKEVFGRDYPFLERDDLLSYEEIARLVRVFVAHGVEKVRFTGGEPLMRRDLPQLIAMLTRVPGLTDLALTTNGMLLASQVAALTAAGLQRITVSLDSLDEEVFAAMNDVGASLAHVLAGIEAATDAGLVPIKINAVVQRGVNDHTIVELARRFRGTGHIVRFIEYMDVGTTNRWQLDHVVPAAEIVERITAEMPIEPVERNYPGEVARRWRYVDGGGEIGIIASVTQPFCGDCTRARLSPEGKLYTCLFASQGHDLRDPLRAGATDEQLFDVVGSLWNRRDDQYSVLRSAETVGQPKIEMSYIGG